MQANTLLDNVQVTYDPSKISYQELLDVYWRQINPTQVNRQFCDKGRQYRSAIFYNNDQERTVRSVASTH